MARRSKKSDAAKSDAAPAEARSSEDIALVWGASDDGETLGVLRKRGDAVTPALMRRAREGQPLTGDLVRLRPREEPLLFDVDVVYEPSAYEPSAQATSAKDGPPRVATDAYRKGWDRLFKRPRPAALN